jgi:hypothetical protein
MTIHIITAAGEVLSTIGSTYGAIRTLLED